MRLSQLPYLLVLLLVLALPVSASAKGGGARTFNITISLAGTYHEETHFTDINEQGFCPGTGNVVDVPFQVTGHTKVTFNEGKTKFENKKLTIENLTEGDWTDEIATVAQGNDCSQIVPFKCGGNVQQAKLDGGNFAYAQDLGKKVVLGARLSYLINPQGSCAADDGYYPAHTNGVFVDALKPYTEAAFVLKDRTFNAIKKGGIRRREFKPLPQNLPGGYDVASCQHADFNVCSAKLGPFTHTIQIRRLK